MEDHPGDRRFVPHSRSDILEQFGSPGRQFLPATVIGTAAAASSASATAGSYGDCGGSDELPVVFTNDDNGFSSLGGAVG